MKVIIVFALLVLATSALAAPPGIPPSPQRWTLSKTFLVPTASDDYIIAYIKDASTLSGMHGICVGGTSASFSLQQCDDDGLSNCANLIADATITSGTKLDLTVADSSIDADKTLKILTGTVTDAVTYCTVTAYGTTP